MSAQKKTRRPTEKKRNLSRDELAAELDVHPETVGRYDRMGAPKERRGRANLYDAAEYRAWMAENKLTGREGRPIETPDSPSLEKAKLRKENALAAKYELQVRRERGELVPVDDVRQWLGQHVSTLRNKLIGLGANVTPQLEGRDTAERQSLIDERVIEYLNELEAAIRDVRSGTQAA